MICRSTLFSSLLYYSYSSLLSSPLYSTTPTPLYSTTIFLSTLLLLLLCTLLFFSLCLLTVSIYMFVKQLLFGGSAGVFQPCGSSQLFFAIFAISCCSMFAKQLLLFFTKSPFSSPLLYFVDDEIVQVHTLYGIWADNQELVRSFASLAASPTLPSLFSVMMPWCSKFMIKWWLTCFWGLYYCYYLFFYYIVVL